MKVYISGAITGTSDYMVRFLKAEEKREKGGSTAINPAKVNAMLPKSTTHEEYMRVSLALMDNSDAVYVLKNWKRSKGVAIELEYARKKKMPIFYEEEDEILRKFEKIANMLCDACPNDSEEGDDGIMKKCRDCQLIDELIEAEKTAISMVNALEKYRGTGISEEDLACIDDEYRKMAEIINRIKYTIDNSLQFSKSDPVVMEQAIKDIKKEMEAAGW